MDIPVFINMVSVDFNRMFRFIAVVLAIIGKKMLFS